MGGDIPELFGQWERFTAWLFGKTAGFPSRLRHSLTARIEARALDVHEALVGARFNVNRTAALQQINLDLDRLRLLLRLAHDLQALDHRAFQYACAELDSAGRMVGGWLRHERAPR